ncbi:MAG: aminopeptidase P N-terminal domain-containing protein [Bacteroidota bacterium]|nr:aminopeptidase P N-terminal domain-containing protein [Bacteroidota bacterium]MDP4234578.1 aminopeptidase P N-terminal domain-containing protein [Bacteroidota bacterium]MDP4243707.1 aminopeptidase P N-terminal domain-containing protein [Bacteroidota bacterium]MDP4288345.1 aminopeptidase P N-terminal domain-containing protein [Bacteroidota bacterium]
MQRLSALLVLQFLLLVPGMSIAQDLGHEVSLDTLHKYGLYDVDRLPPSFHANRRKCVLDSMAPHSVAVLLSTREKVRSNDIDYEFHEDPNFYYLTGCLEPKSALILSKDPISVAGHGVHEILFVQQRDPKQETWTGKRLGPEGALAVLRPESALPIDSLNDYLQRLLPHSDSLYYRPIGLKPESDPVYMSAPNESMPSVENPYKVITSTRLSKVLAELREVKMPEELRLMRRAIAISNEAHNAVIRKARPGWYEYQIQGLAESIFTENGAEYTAYPCIVGSGPNSTILHYETNRRQTQPGDFIEMDMGAEYHGYAADVTRSFPISGQFTPEQRTIYSLVLEAQDSGIQACQAGAAFWAAHFAARRVIVRGLLRLGIIKDSNEYRQYFMHGTSHYLGLDVHDAGTGGPLRSGNVLTVEPGIYIPEGSPCDRKWWNIGCRIEDDILITPTGPEILSRNSPRTIPELERLMVRTR